MSAVLAPAIVATSLLAMGASGEPLARRITPARAAYLGDAIAAVTDEPREVAALEVSIVREGGIDERVERCAITTPTGRGAFQLNPRFWSRPIACGHPIVQAYAALDVLRAAHFGINPAKGLQLYLGARSPNHPEARHRFALWRETLSRLECMCSR